MIVDDGGIERYTRHGEAHELILIVHAVRLKHTVPQQTTGRKVGSEMHAVHPVAANGNLLPPELVTPIGVKGAGRMIVMVAPPSIQLQITVPLAS